jgi:hypothetical protein
VVIGLRWPGTCGHIKPSFIDSKSVADLAASTA